MSRQVFPVAFAGLLVGLMFFDKPFAYLGIGHVFITELVLVLGLGATLAHLRNRGFGAWHGVPRLQTAALAVFLAYEGVRTALDIPQYRLLALRDGVVWGYALFAVIIVTVAGDDSLRRWAAGYRRLAPVFVAWVPIALLLYILGPAGLTVPGQPVSLYLFKPGDLLVHLSGVGAALALWPGSGLRPGCDRRWSWWLAVLWGAGFLMAASLSRGGLLACLAGLLVVAVLGPSRQVLKPAAGALLALLLLFATGLHIEVPAKGQGALAKEISAQQFVTQVRSTVLQAVGLLSGEPGPAAGRRRRVSGAAPTARSAHRAAPVASPVTAHSTHARAPMVSPVPTRPAHLAAPVASPVPAPRGEKSAGWRARPGTIRWRLMWWRAIVGYTFRGPYFLSGKGFGVNLADADGFQPEKNHGLRDPHNVFMTFLARSGVPGLALFVILIGTVSWNLLTAWRRSDGEERRLNVWLLAYLTAMLVNACFDVYVENPMGGVWFWSLVGAAMVVTAQPHGRREDGETSA